MKMSSAFPGRRRKPEVKHEKRETPVTEAREMREPPPRRPTLRLNNKRGK